MSCQVLNVASGAPDFSVSNPPPGTEDLLSSVSSASTSPTSSARAPGTSTSPPPRVTTDHFVVNSVQPTSSAQSQTVSSTPHFASASPPIPTASSSTAPSNVNAIGNRSGLSLGAVLGGTIGGIGGLLLLTGAILVYRYLRTPRAVHMRQRSVSTNGDGQSYGHDEKYLEPPNSAGLSRSSLSIYVSEIHLVTELRSCGVALRRSRC